MVFHLNEGFSKTYPLTGGFNYLKHINPNIFHTASFFKFSIFFYPLELNQTMRSSEWVFLRLQRLFYIGDRTMNKLLLFIFVLLICTSQLLHNYQMRNADIDTDRMQRYVEHINATNQLNVYDRR